MTLRTVRDLLAEAPAFRGFDPAALDELAGCARNETFAPGDLIFRENERVERVWILRRGDVGLEIAVPGRDPVTVETLHPGDVLGWAWLTPESRAMSDARALSEVGAVGLDAACVRAKCDADPVVGYQMFKHWLPHLAARVRAQRLQLLDLYGRDAG
jgi:CRP-like cAMP-binding protein